MVILDNWLKWVIEKSKVKIKWERLVGFQGMKYYTVPNLSVQATQVTTSFFQMLSKLSETFV
jgi:hypothetical protein